MQIWASFDYASEQLLLIYEQTLLISWIALIWYGIAIIYGNKIL